MIVVMKKGASVESIQRVVKRIEEIGLKAHLSVGTERTIIGVIGDWRAIPLQAWEAMAEVERAVPILHRFKLASRDFHPENTVISLREGVEIGGRAIVVMAGPCAVESREQMRETAWAVKEAGAKILRGGAFKPRTSPYSFQGLGEKGLELLKEAAEETGLLVITEVMSAADVALVASYTDILQIGTRNMTNYSLLHKVGESHRPVLLKRGMMATLEELLMSAEYLLSHDNRQVMLCERGIRTFESYTRYTLDINAIPALHELTHLPVIVDPSHATGKWSLVEAVSKAAVAAGADGLLMEVHPHPEQALSDGGQSLKPARFATLMEHLKRIAKAVGRELC